MKKLLIILVLILSGCGANEEKATLNTVQEMHKTVLDGGAFSYQISSVEDAFVYSVQRDNIGNIHISDDSGETPVHLYIFDDKFYDCSFKCEEITDSYIYKTYKSEYNTSLIEKFMSNATQDTTKDFSYLEEITSGIYEYSVTNKEGVTTITYNTSSKEKEIISINKEEDTIIYDFNGKPDQKLVISTKEVKDLVLPLED